MKSASTQTATRSNGSDVLATARMSPSGMPLPTTVGDILAGVDGHIAEVGAGAYRSVATGFVPLDDVLAGGLHSGDLFLIAGSPGTGKTTMMLQMARNVAASA